MNVMKYFSLFLLVGVFLFPSFASAATVIASSTTSSLSVPVAAGDILLVNAKGTVEQGTFGNVCVDLNMAGVSKDQTCTDDDNVTPNARFAYPLMFSTEPGATTTLITLTTSFGSLNDIKIIAQVISPDSGGGGSATTTPQNWELIMPYFLLFFMFLACFHLFISLFRHGRSL